MTTATPSRLRAGLSFLFVHTPVALFFMGVVVLVLAASIREWVLILSKRKPAVLRESPPLMRASPVVS